MLQTANRVAGLFGDESTSTPLRSPAQIASRRNGSRSRGPLTREGKARSRRNALRHGIFARHVQPPEDHQGYRQDYRRLRADLLAEFQPTTLRQIGEIDTLAADLLRAARVRSVIEAAMTVPSVPDRVREIWPRIAQAQAQLQAAQQALRDMERGGVPLLPGKAAQHLAGGLAEWVKLAVADLRAAEAEGQEAEGPPGAVVLDSATGKSARAAEIAARVGADEAKELGQVRALLTVLGPATGKYRDPRHLAGWLAGERTLTGRDRQRLKEVLRRWMADTAAWLDGQADVQRQIQKAHAVALQTLAGQVDRLQLLETYLSRIERNVDRAYERLDRRLAPGSFFQNGGRNTAPRGGRREDHA